MAKRLYEVRLRGGKNNKNYQKFFINTNNLNGKPPDFGGINSVALVSHHADEKTVHFLCTMGFKSGEDDVTVEEVTKESLMKNHLMYKDQVESYFLPYNEYPNISN